ncbi:alkaline shock response membrane anchor protein AmaP [Streptomyces sp. ST2-7A]|uniref:alkaline shock response membrane anchor protein AmaP n=1 Tax=Streptomyces sp. ST2-7A TaxID=2907214 RepID=UPI001F2FC847|nr:alkaline shock response membrane anchor protein AmaP [Streptomyces sp. ST2-7A]MCE7082243.1 alkaline shock response membrane anchor protein AmaP [Streptomyces sp. ST2-7A]
MRIVNRVLMALIGVLLVVAGATVVAAALDLPARWGLRLPDGWSPRAPDDVLLADADRTRWVDEGWWWPVVIGVLSLLVLLTLWWALTQARRGRRRELPLDVRDGSDATVLRGAALEEVVTAEIESFPGVERARAALDGGRGGPRLRVGVVLEADARPGEVVRRLRTETLEHVRASTGLERLPADLRVRSTRHSAERVE